MSPDIRFVVDSDPEFAGVKLALTRIEQKLDAQGVGNNMAFADLKADLVAILGSLANIDADVAAQAKTIEDLKALIAVGMTPDQVAEAQALADQAKAFGQAIADRTPDVPEPPVVPPVV